VVLVGVVSAVLGACGGHSKKTGDAGETSGFGGASGFGTSPVSAGTSASGDGGNASSSSGSSTGGIHSSGGSAIGGAQASGGSAIGGATSNSGTGGATTTLPNAPENCKALSQSVTNDICSYAFECDGLTFYSRCDSGPNAAWACYCETKRGAIMKELMFHDIAGGAACGAMARACMTEPPAGERVCERTSESFGATCGIEESCGPTYDLGSGIKANGVGRYSVNCSPMDDGNISCACTPPSLGKQEYTLTAPSMRAACEAMIGVCRDGVSAAVAPGICADTPETTPNTCSVSRTCTRDVALGNGVSLTSKMTRKATCAVGDDEVSGCTCQGEMLSRFDLQAKLGTGTNPCRTTLDACTGATKVEPTGPVHCTIDGYGMGVQECSQRLTCSRPVSVGTAEATGSGKLNLACWQFSTGPSWWCSCASKGAPKIFKLGAAPTPTDACQAAYDRCPKEVEIDFGPHIPMQEIQRPF
jgi:hypothetical protein